MPALNKLSSLRVKNAQPGKYSDGGGLWLHKKDGDGGKARSALRRKAFLSF